MPALALLALAAASTVAAGRAAAPASPIQLAHASHHRGLARRRSAFPGSPRGSVPPLRRVGNDAGGYVLAVTDFGADPTGRTDSSAAITKALKEAWAIGRRNGYNFSFGPDLGGVVVDLVGGQYLLESPVAWPAQAGGNVVVQHGSLHAGASFPAGRYLFELDSVPPPEGVGGGGCLGGDDPLSAGCLTRPAAGRLSGTATGYDDVTFRSVLFDSALRGGGLKLLNALRVYVDGCYFLGYAAGSAGLWTTEAGGAAYVAQSWFSGFDWPSERCGPDLGLTGTALLVEFPDSMAEEVIVACSWAGMVDRSGAFIASSVHVFGVSNAPGSGYFSYEKPQGASRLVAPYVDFSRIFVAAGAALSVEQGFFLGCARAPNETTHPFIVVNASVSGARVVEVTGLTVRSSQFHGRQCGGDGVRSSAIETRGLAGRGVALTDSVVEDNVFLGMQGVATRLRGSVFGTDTGRFELDWTHGVAFPDAVGLGASAFDSLVVGSKRFDSSPVVAAVVDAASVGGLVVVTTSENVTGSVSVHADQSSYSTGRRWADGGHAARHSAAAGLTRAATE